MDTEVSIEKFLDRAAELERAVADLYSAIAREMPEQAEFFNRMAEEERDHANALDSFLDIIDTDAATVNPLRPTLFEIEEGIEFVTKKRLKVAEGECDLKWAVDVALLIESSQLEKNYTRHLVGQSDAVRKLLAGMARGERDHIDRLKGLSMSG